MSAFASKHACDIAKTTTLDCIEKLHRQWRAEIVGLGASNTGLGAAATAADPLDSLDKPSMQLFLFMKLHGVLEVFRMSVKHTYQPVG